LKHELDEPQAAADDLEHALSADPGLSGAPVAPAEARRLLARWRLEAGQAERARLGLSELLRQGADPEASWLLSRALLQQGDAAGSIAAQAKAGRYASEREPTAFDASPYAGSAKCAQCHADIYRGQQSSRHARTLYEAKDLGSLPLPQGPLPDPAEPGITHIFTHKNDTVRVETRARDKIYRALVEYALGSGDRGLTLVGRDTDGTPRVLRLSLYAGGTAWDLTPAVEPHPTDPKGYVGRPLNDEALRLCLDCHLTSMHALRHRSSPEASDHGIGCERCHGPARNHVQAMELALADPAIARPRLASAEQVVKVCARCHDSDDPSLPESDPRFVRFQTTTMIRSRCYTESEGGLSCLTCHNPHRNAETAAAHYESRCLACHGSGKGEVAVQNHPRWTGRATLPKGRKPVLCPVNATKGCIACHMPTVKNVAPHTDFTNHQIRVHRSVGGG
jgi:hypothetical protein